MVCTEAEKLSKALHNRRSQLKTGLTRGAKPRPLKDCEIEALKVQILDLELKQEAAKGMKKLQNTVTTGFATVVDTVVKTGEGNTKEILKAIRGLSSKEQSTGSTATDTGADLFLLSGEVETTEGFGKSAMPESTAGSSEDNIPADRGADFVAWMMEQGKKHEEYVKWMVGMKAKQDQYANESEGKTLNFIHSVMNPQFQEFSALPEDEKKRRETAFDENMSRQEREFEEEMMRQDGEFFKKMREEQMVFMASI